MGGQKNTNFVWTPTKRRGPIAAEFQTPGPAAINLPSTFGARVAVKARSPAFSISGRHDAKPDSSSPGPGQYNVNGLSYKGKDDAHAPSMHVKPKDPKMFVTPAPCDYQPEKSFAVMEPSHKFSFGVKVDNSNLSNVPGPGSYNEAEVDKYKTLKSPAFSMGMKATIPSDNTMKPGPGAHCPEKYNSDEGPKWTMVPRHDDSDHSFVPGPGTYESGSLNTVLMKQPVYTMSPRFDLPTDKTPKPAPNTYNAEKYNPNEGPKWTIRSRLDDADDSFVPGPGTYESGNLNNILKKEPIFTMSPKTDLPTDKTQKPAPNAYNSEKYNPNEGPKWTIRGRLDDADDSFVPGPGTYESGNLNNILKKEPIFTMSPKTDLPTDKTQRPAPNAYNSEKYNPNEGPKWTIRGRLDDADDSFVPGPGTYESGNLNNILKKEPIFTMSPKTDLPTDKTQKPAPNAYNSEKVVLKKTPEFSFGVKHSPYAGQLRDQ